MRPSANRSTSRYARRAAHRVRFGGWTQCLDALLDQRHPEGHAPLQAETHHLLIALLEDVQVQRHAGEQHRIKGEERQLEHGIILKGSGAKILAWLSLPLTGKIDCL